MDKENIHNGALYSHKEEWNSAVFRKMDRTGYHLVDQVSQTQPNIECFCLYVESRSKNNNNNNNMS
jgi:hypothetical protein